MRVERPVAVHEARVDVVAEAAADEARAAAERRASAELVGGPDAERVPRRVLELVPPTSAGVFDFTISLSMQV